MCWWIDGSSEALSVGCVLLDWANGRNVDSFGYGIVVLDAVELFE